MVEKVKENNFLNLYFTYLINQKRKENCTYVRPKSPSLLFSLLQLFSKSHFAQNFRLQFTPKKKKKI